MSSEGIRSLAVAGLSKNAGKTTVLNHLAASLNEEGKPYGFVSIGVDGEERDVWTLKEKPPIVVPKGSLVATAAPLLDGMGGGWELLESTSLVSPLGPVILARSLQGGKMKLAGVTRAEGIREVVLRFLQQGARLVLVDGAYDRKAATSPWITDAAICVVGANLARTLDGVVEKTEEVIRRLTLPETVNPLERLATETALANNRLVGVRDGAVEILPCSSLLLTEQAQEALAGRVWEAVALPGSLTDRGMHFFMKQNHAPAVILRDPTRCFVSMRVIRRFYRMGGTLSYWKGVRLIAVAINPVSPEGYVFDPKEMKERIADVCHPIPVFDAVRDGIRAIRSSLSGG